MRTVYGSLDATAAEGTGPPNEQLTGMDGLLAEHDSLFQRFLDEVGQNPMAHINPYTCLELLRQQHDLIRLLDQRLRAVEARVNGRTKGI